MRQSSIYDFDSEQRWSMMLGADCRPTDRQLRDSYFDFECLNPARYRLLPPVWSLEPPQGTSAPTTSGSTCTDLYPSDEAFQIHQVRLRGSASELAPMGRREMLKKNGYRRNDSNDYRNITHKVHRSASCAYQYSHLPNEYKYLYSEHATSSQPFFLKIVSGDIEHAALLG
jgi:hypothetical protein